MVILRSFSKNYGLAGMRIGYAVVSDAKIASSLQHLRGTFNVGHLAQTAAFAALKLSNWLPYVREFHQKEKEKLYRVFEKLTIPYIMSQANFLLFSLGGNGRATVKAFEQRGIVLRAMADWKMPEEWVRLTIGSEQENDKFVSILEEILREQK
jgi:histidinol-phosphate aminotransferase